MAWLFGYRRLTIRYERKASHFCAFLTLGAALTSYKKLAKSPHGTCAKGCLVTGVVVGAGGVLPSAGEEDVVQVCDAGHCVVQRAGGASIVTQDLLALHPRQSVLDPSPDCAVAGIEVFQSGGALPSRGLR
jgi:hypothetical protein